MRVQGSLSRRYLSGNRTDVRANRRELFSGALSPDTQLSEDEILIDNLSGGRALADHRFAATVPLRRHAGQTNLSADVQLPGGAEARVRGLLSVQREATATRHVPRGRVDGVFVRAHLSLRPRVPRASEVLQQQKLRW